MTRPVLLAEENRWLKLLSSLNEAQQRWYVADKALDCGRGGITRLSEVTGMSRTTITKAIAEVTANGPLREGTPGFPVRRSGGGRRKAEEVDPALLGALRRIVEETTAGDPMSLLKWTTKSTRGIAEELPARWRLPTPAIARQACSQPRDRV